MVPYQDRLEGSDAAAVIAETPARLAKIYAAVPDANVAAAPGKWSPRELMCHLADCEIAWAWRLRFAYEKDGGTLQPFDQDPWAKIYGAYTLVQAQATFTALRAWNIAFVGALTEADKQKPVLHPQHGAWTLWNLVEMMAGHDLHHLRIMEAKG